MTKPKIRLKGFKGEWEEKTFSQIVNVNSGMDYKGLNAGNIPVYGTGGYMLSVDKSLSNEDAIGIGRKGTIDSPQLLKAPFWTIDTLFFMTLKKGYDLNFIYSLCQTVRWKDYDESTGVPSLSKNNIDRIESFVPNISEQKCIANYFKSLDSMIQGVTKKIASLKQMKQACLVSMFPQAGETTPRVRFKGFKGEWQEKSFGELYYHNVIKNDMSFNVSKVISVANMYFNPNTYISDPNYLRTYNIFKLGDIAFEGNKSKNFAHGRFVENTIGDGIVSHVFEVFSPINQDYDLNYWKYAINNERIMGKILMRCTKASTMMTNLVANDFLKEKILIPSNDEQKKIGLFFTSLDKQISLQEARLEKLKQIKAACLDKMFV